MWSDALSGADVSGADGVIRRHCILHGSVQGVGLRYRAFHEARQLGVSGFVRNLSDGTVEIEAEGRREALDDLIAMIGRGHFVEIEDVDCRQIPVQGDAGFEIED